MKAERRHELKHNELSDWLGERLEALKPHATGILLGFVLLLAIVLGGIMYFGGESQTSAAAWSDYFGALNQRDPQKVLQDLAAKQSGSKAAWWALEALGDMNLGEGAALLYSDRAEAAKRLEAAEKAYKQVEVSDDPMLKSRARLGLAKVYESQCKPEEARKYYELVAESQKDSAIGKAAAADATRMKNAREVEFLGWFAQQTPKRPAAMPGFGGGVPGLPNDLPERPDIGLPTSGLNLGNIGTGTPAEPAATFPAPAPSTDSVPPDPTATAAAKADDAKPAETAPAATTPEPAKPAEPSAGEKKSD